MPTLRRPSRDDVDVESFLANLHRIADVATSPIRRVIDLTRSHRSDVTEVDAREDDGVKARAER